MSRMRKRCRNGNRVSYIRRSLQALEGSCQNLDVAGRENRVGCHIDVVVGYVMVESVGRRMVGRRIVEKRWKWKMEE